LLSSGFFHAAISSSWSEEPGSEDLSALAPDTGPRRSSATSGRKKQFRVRAISSLAVPLRKFTDLPARGLKAACRKGVVGLAH
jgi:hypothetical protein